MTKLYATPDSNAPTLSAKDQTVLDALRQDARISISDLARQLGVSRSTVQNRIERLQDIGVIAGYTVRLSESFRNQRVRAHVLATAKLKQSAEIVTALRRLPAVDEIHSVSGEHDFIILVSETTVARLDTAIDAIIEIDGIERTKSSVILSTKFKR